MQETYNQLQAAQEALEPQFKALRAVMSALKSAQKLAAAESADALPMNKALIKLETAAASVDNAELAAAVRAFAADTQSALDNLAFDFAKDLRDVFAARGETVEGRPPILTVGMLTFNIDIAARKGQWLYGKDALTRPIPLSLTGIIKAYDKAVKRVVNRQIDEKAFLAELQQAWQDCIDKRDRRPHGGRINIVEIHGQVTLNRQAKRFWNAPSRSTFKDYERELFIRDLTLLRDSNTTTITVKGEQMRLKIGGATKSQADQASRSMWLPTSALDGDYYGDISFD